MTTRLILLLLLSLEVHWCEGSTLENGTHYPERSDRCYNDLGCFSSGGDFFHPLYRPLDLLPQDRQKINTRFKIYSKDSPKEYHLLKVKDDKSLVHFRKDRDLKIIVHGYIDNQLFGEWMRDMKDEFLLNGDVNVVIVDWSGGNGLPYLQAAANTRIVGAEIALLIRWLQEKTGLKTESVHILGHSLGSHVAGYAGERLRKLGRITAMDPAEPYFQNLPANVRIDPTDAEYVDVIHTDSKSILLFGFGMSQLVGHVDIFPNDGKDQPGCTNDKMVSIITDGLVQGVREFVSCNHQRAVSFVIDSINRHRCQFVAHLCKDWDTFLAGKCSGCAEENCALMSPAATKIKGPTETNNEKMFFLKTNTESPFCLYHYQVSLVLDKSSNDQDGVVELSIHGSEGEETFTLGGGKISLEGGSTLNFLVTTARRLGDIVNTRLYWEVKKFIPPIIFTSYLRVSTLTVTPMNEMDPQKVMLASRRYCLWGSDIDHKKSITLTKDDICPTRAPQGLESPIEGNFPL